MLQKLKEEVYKANIALPEHGLVNFTWGNVSGIDREKGLVVIKPSGVEYDALSVESMVVVDMDGNVVEGDLNPSVDTHTHISLYKSLYPDIGAVVHTHSTWATVFAQCGMDIPAYGTTHADYFFGSIPCTRALTDKQVCGEYERNTGLVIARTFVSRDLDPVSMPAVLVKNHGPFAWGNNPMEAVKNAAILEIVAHMAFHTRLLGGSSTEPVSDILLQRHYDRKHGEDSTYGQR